MDSTDHDALSAILPAVLFGSSIGKTDAEPVLADVSLSRRAGEVLALAGENGAGKRTLSKIIGGLVEPDCRHDAPRQGTLRAGYRSREALLHASVIHEAGTSVMTGQSVREGWSGQPGAAINSVACQKQSKREER